MRMRARTHPLGEPQNITASRAAATVHICMVDGYMTSQPLDRAGLLLPEGRAIACHEQDALRAVNHFRGAMCKQSQVEMVHAATSVNYPKLTGGLPCQLLQKLTKVTCYNKARESSYPVAASRVRWPSDLGRYACSKLM